MRIALILLLCCSLAFGDQITQEMIAAGGDDGQVLRGGGALTTNGTSLTIGRNIGGLSYWLYFRFTSIPIPAGSVIDTAIFTIISNSTTSTTTVNGSLFCIDSADAGAPADSTALFGSAQTSAVSYWANLPSMTQGTSYRWGGATGNVKDPVAEVMALAGWASGNDLVIICKDSSSTNNRTRTIAAEENTDRGPATLDIYYTPPSGVPSVYHGVAGIGRLHSPAGNSVLHKK